MCGRFAVQLDVETLLDFYRQFLGVERGDIEDFPLRYNIAPSQEIYVIRPGADDLSQCSLTTMRWGLVPHWAKDDVKSFINARSETADTSKAFSRAFREGRCLVPATGFYAWAETANGKQPHFIGMREGRPFAFAGILSRWGAAPGVETCAILTTDANACVRPIHHRMPVILRPEAYAAWIGKDAADAKAQLQPHPADKMTAHPVGKMVNNPRADGPACAKPISLKPAIESDFLES